MTYVILLASSLLAVVLVLILIREHRLRRALESLLRRLLTRWRKHETNRDTDSAGPAAGGLRR